MLGIDTCCFLYTVC